MEEEEVIDMKTVSPDYFVIDDLQEVDEEGYDSAPVGIDPKEAFSVANVLGKSAVDDNDDRGRGGVKKRGRGKGDD